MISGSAKKVMLIGVAFFLVIMMFAAVGIGGGSTEDDIDLSTSLLSEAVERYRPYVTKRAEGYDMADHVELILCVMEVESHGEVWTRCRLQSVLSTRNIQRYPMASVILNIP